jgi:hypothetical protein
MSAMNTNLNQDIAREVIRSRTTHRDTYQRPHHARTARALRGLAERLDRRA